MMNNKSKIRAAIALCVGVLAAAAHAAGFITADFALAGGLVPLAIGETDFGTLKELLVKQGEEFSRFKNEHNKEADELRQAVFEMEKKLGRPGATYSPDELTHTGNKLRSADGREFYLLSKGDRLSSPGDFSPSENERFSIGDYVRSSIVGSHKAMGSGPALVPTSVSNEIIDDIRAKAVIVDAGAKTVVIDGPTVFARINGDPTVIQHVENVEDITESDVSIGPVTVNPQLLVALIPLSEEVVRDSPNLDNALRQAISSAFAQKLDQISLAKIIADENIPATEGDSSEWISLISHLTSISSAVGRGVPDVMLSAMSSYLIRNSIQDAGMAGGAWLGTPPALAKARELPTTNIEHGNIIFGGFDLGFMIAARSELRLEVIRWRNAGKGQHALVAHAAIDGYVVQPKALSRLHAIE